jgi:hypothetical protein
MLLASERVGPATLQLYAGVCPLCLKADREERGGPLDTRHYMRNWWSLPQITSCPAHSCAILLRCHECGRRLLHRLNGSMCVNCKAQLCDAPIEAVNAHASSYLVGRLGAQEGRPQPLLDGLPWNVAAAAIRYVGIISLDPHTGDPRRLTNADLAGIDSAGLKLLDDWPNGFVGLVTTLREARKSRGFKRLLRWLGRPAPEFAPFRSIFDEMVPGRCRRPPGMLLSGVETARALGVGHGPFERLVKGGLVPPSPGHTGWRHGFYRQADVDALLRDLFDRAPLVTSSPSAVPITETGRIARIGVSDVVRAIQSGRVRVAGLAPGIGGLSRVLVEPAELLALLPGRIPWKDVASRLQVSQSASIQDAVAFGILKPPTRVGVTFYFSEQDLQECLATYTSVRALRLRMLTPIDPRSLINAMRRAGLKSVCYLKHGGHIFSRPAAETLLPRIGYQLAAP